MSNDSLATFVDSLRDSSLLDDSQIPILNDLQSSHAEPRDLASALLERGCLTAWQAEQLVAYGPQGLILGQYVLLEPLGEGGMGQVFKARHQRMKRVVALKVIREESASCAADVQRFAKEIEAAAQLTHPNVIMAFDANESDGKVFFVMEYVEGIDLSRLIKQQGALPIGEACEYMRQAALGLQHAHEKGLVHRDIKPSNFLLTFADASVKVLDMGLARFQQTVGATSSTELTRTGAVMGTPDFISPEQGRDARAVDIRSDLYSLGCTLYYLLSARVPFPEGTFTEKLLKHNMEEPTPLVELRPDVPEDLRAVVRRLMAKQPDQRYQTPAETAEALQPFAEPQTSAERYRPRDRSQNEFQPTVIPSYLPLVSSKGPRSGPSLSRGSRTNVMSRTPVVADTAWSTLPGKVQRRSNRGLIVLSLAILFAAVVGGIIAWRLVPGPRDVAAVLPGAGASNEGASHGSVDPRGSGGERLPTGKAPPDTRVVVAPPQPPALGTLVRLRDRERSTRSEPLRASLSLDGRWALAAWGPNVRLWDLDHLKPDDKPTHHLNLNLAANNPVTAVAIAADGKRALLGFKTDEPAGKSKKPRDVFAVGMWTPGSADEPELLEGHKDEVTCLALSARGNFALSGSNDRTVRYWNLETGALVQPPLNHGDLVSCVAFSPDGRYALSGGRDKTIALWDLESGKRVASATEHDTLVSCVAFSRDGKFALSGSHDRKICLYEVENLKKIGTFPGHTGAVRCLSFSPDGGLFLSGGEDETVRLWRPPQRENIECFKEHKRGVVDVTVQPGGRYALSISSDNTIHRWDLAPAKEP